MDYPLGKGPSPNRAPLGDAVGGTSAERSVLDVAAAPILGVPVEDVPDVTSLLLGPMARGMEVDVR